MAHQSKPNILFIMDDQHRFDFLGCAGADYLNTPNIDRLAAMGVRFSNCFTNAPVCSPARIALATGLQPSRIGSLNNSSFLPLSTPTHYQIFRDNGYYVGCNGKLDLAKPESFNGVNGDRPCTFAYGFTHPEENEGKMHAGGSAQPRGPYGLMLQEKGEYQKFHEDYKLRSSKGWNYGVSHDSVLDTEDFEDIYIGRRAAQWIEDVPGDFPFYYFVSFVGPHDPFDPPTEYADRYRNADVPPAITDSGEGKPEWIKRRMRKEMDAEEISITRRQYCASIEAIDNGIGLILDALEKKGIIKNTVIVFTSDHGEMLGDHGLYAKSVPYESSIHVPLIIAGPGIDGERVSDAIVELIDCNATVCELAGLTPTPNIDAQSVVPILKKETDSHRDEAVSMLNNFRCIRTKRYKFIENQNDINELYDLQNDPWELTNIAGENNKLCENLRRRLNSRFIEGKWLR